ncbi:MAG: coenzyme F420-0:L-glutamate ligase, partial [Clostridia bacterium]|nr:coenzyme F420-0:L-glutamate ligase [Clostridia bacterium]
DSFADSGLNPYSDALTVADFRRLFGAEVKHPFTGVDYIDFYQSLGGNIDVILCSDPQEVLKHTDQVIAADIHRRRHTKRSLEKAGARVVIGLDDILIKPVDGSGFNEQYGLLGSNKASEDTVKLFPRNCNDFVERLHNALQSATGCQIEVLIYGDGGFKDPVGGIWELADPVISPAFTSGLVGTPNELKLKYLADNDFAGLEGEELQEALKKAIRAKERSGRSLVGKMESEGTTPRQLTDLLGSLCDLTSGSGDKGTPIVLIQGYFDNYATEGDQGLDSRVNVRFG